MTAAPETRRRPTNVRLVILFMTTIVAVLLYLDRICLGFAEIYVTEDLNLTKQQMGFVLSSFFLTYAIAQVPAGWLSDRYGARRMLTIYLAAWSVCTGLMGLAYGLVSLLLLRLGCGLFQAGAYPTCAGLVRKWIPFARRGLASAVVSIGGRLGGAFAPPLTAYLMIAFVPVDTPSLLESDTVLPGKGPALVQALDDPRTYVQKGVASKSKTPEKPEETAKRAGQVQVLRRIASKLPQETVAYLKSVQVFTPADGIGPTELAPIVDALNSVLAEPRLFEDMDLADLRLPQSARNLMEAEPSELSASQVTRRNRLVLEAALPAVVRKVYGTGWRPTMLVYGAFGVLFALHFWWFFRDSPRQHPAVNPEELALIEGNDPSAGATSSSPPPLPWKAFLQSRSLWLISAVQFLTNLGWVFLITWFPGYLAEVHGVPVDIRSWMTLLPLFVGIAGMFLGGWLTDWATSKLGLKNGRRWPMCISRFLAAAAFLACLFLNSPWPVTLAMALVAFATDLGTPSMWAYSLDVGGKNTGSVLGWSNMWGNLGAAVSPVLLESVRAGYGYNAVFIVCGAGFILSGFLCLGVDATKPISADGK